MIIIEIHKNAEGNQLAYAYKSGNDCSFRIAGPKAWGGSTLIAKQEISECDMIEFINCFIPEIIPQLMKTEYELMK